MTTEPLTPAADAIKELTALASQARGIEFVTIDAPEGQAGIPDKIPVAIRRGTTPEIISLARDFEAWREHPKRKTGTARAITAESFVDLVERHKTEESVIFADTDWHAPSMTAIIDYHDRSGDIADNCRHRIHYDFPLSDDWKVWIANNGEAMQQQAFAEFIEERIADLATPNDAERAQYEALFQTRFAAPNELIQLSRGLQINVASAVKNVVTLQTGEAQIRFEEEHQDADGKPIKVPGLFLLRVAPFFRGETVSIAVRLRYRVRAGAVTWFFQLYRPDLVITDEVRAELQRVADSTDLPTFEGTPEIVV